VYHWLEDHFMLICFSVGWLSSWFESLKFVQENHGQAEGRAAMLTLGRFSSKYGDLYQCTEITVKLKDFRYLILVSDTRLKYA
jgi:hypothetical protein